MDIEQINTEIDNASLTAIEESLNYSFLSLITVKKQ